MEHVDLFRYSEQFAEQFAAANTFVEFAASLDANKPGPGRLLQSIAERYPDSWELSFQTIKEHGFTGGPLLFPKAHKVADIFADVKLYPYATGGKRRDEIDYVRDGYAFVSCVTRAKGFAYFGHLGARYDWSPTWLERGEKVRRLQGGQYWLTAAKPTQAVVDAYGSGCGADEWDLATFEAVTREDGRTLIVARANNGFGSRWLALLDVGESALPMLSDHERGEIAAEYEAQREAWGAISGEFN